MKSYPRSNITTRSLNIQQEKKKKKKQDPIKGYPRSNIHPARRISTRRDRLILLWLVSVVLDVAENGGVICEGVNEAVPVDELAIFEGRCQSSLDNVKA